jgi:hypothetical protein
MNKEILCFIDMFSLTQNIQIGEKVMSISTSEIGKVLPSLCYSNHTNKIHLFGNDAFIDGIITEISENQDYSSLEIKVN